MSYQPLKGQKAIVTGANSGLGLEGSRAFAAKGARVFMGCRNAEKSEKARQSIVAQYPAAPVEVMALDLASLVSMVNGIRLAAKLSHATTSSLRDDVVSEWHAMDADLVLHRLGSSANGLTQAEAERRKAEARREESEALREAANDRREKDELDRIRAELLRVANEADRRTAERLRVIAEQLRTAAEELRRSAEEAITASYAANVTR